MSELEDLLKCAMCKQIFTGLPITLICCNATICEHHKEEQLDLKEQKKFRCNLCDTLHIIENNKIFITNKIAQQLLEMKLVQKLEKVQNANFGDIYAKTNEEIENLELSFKEINDLLKDPNNFIFETISNIKREVDLRKEKLKEKIDEISEEMIHKLDNYEKKCYENIVINKLEEKTSDMFKEIQANLEEWNKEDKSILMVSNDSKRKEIQSKAIEFDTKIFAALIDLKKELLMNKNWVYLENEKVTAEFEKELIQFEG